MNIYKYLLKRILLITVLLGLIALIVFDLSVLVQVCRNKSTSMTVANWSVFLFFLTVTGALTLFPYLYYVLGVACVFSLKNAAPFFKLKGYSIIKPIFLCLTLLLISFISVCELTTVNLFVQTRIEQLKTNYFNARPNASSIAVLFFQNHAGFTFIGKIDKSKGHTGKMYQVENIFDFIKSVDNIQITSIISARYDIQNKTASNTGIEKCLITTNGSIIYSNFSKDFNLNDDYFQLDHNIYFLNRLNLKSLTAMLFQDSMKNTVHLTIVKYLFSIRIWRYLVGILLFSALMILTPDVKSSIHYLIFTGVLFIFIIICEHFEYHTMIILFSLKMTLVLIFLLFGLKQLSGRVLFVRQK